jgi:hypothetical protein
LVVNISGDFARDNHGTLTWGSRKYSEKVLAKHGRNVGALPAKKSSLMEKGDSPKIDQSTELDVGGISLYQFLIGVLQWAVTLGIFDIMVAVMSMSHFRLKPCVRHLERLK